MRMHRLLWFLALVSLTLGAQVVTPGSNRNFPPVIVFDPANQRAISVNIDNASISLGRNGKSHVLRIVESGKTTLANLPEEMLQVDEIRSLPGQRILVRGMVNASTSEIVLVDKTTNRIIDQFLCYLPTISPTNDSIAFVKFYPAHFVEGVTDVYMLYDLSRSPRENRRSNASESEIISVGKPIYPSNALNEPSDNVGLSPSDQHKAVSAGFFWTPDGNSVLFADELGETITVLFAQQVKGPASMLRQVQIRAASLCEAAQLHATRCTALLRDVEFQPSPASSVSLHFQVNVIHSVDYVYSFTDFKVQSPSGTNK